MPRALLLRRLAVGLTYLSLAGLSFLCVRGWRGEGPRPDAPLCLTVCGAPSRHFLSPSLSLQSVNAVISKVAVNK